VLAALRWRADIFAQAQPTVIRRLAKGRREEVPDHYAWKVLRNPCAWQTGFRWRHLNMIRAQLGNAYNIIVAGGGSLAQELRPVDVRAKIHAKAQRADGSLVYEYRPYNEPARDIGQENVLHFRGFSIDGIEGVAMSTLIRNSVAIALLAERHIATSLRRGARIAGLLVPEGDPGGKFNRQQLAESVNETFSAPEVSGALGVLPYGVKFQAISMDNQKAQLLEIREFQVGDILRFLGVPGVVVGFGDKTSTFASAEAFFAEAERCVLPWVTNFEAEEMKSLLPADSNLQIKHNLDSVLRAETLKRYDALFKASGRAWITGNEARGTEDMDPIDDDPTMDSVAPPPNTNGGEGGDPSQTTKPAGARPPAKPKPAPPVPADDGEAALVERLRWSALQAWTSIAAHVVRREVADLTAAALRFHAEPERWRAWVGGYYDRHAVTFERSLHLQPSVARACAEEHRAAVLAGGLAAAKEWTNTEDAEGYRVVSKLAWLALGEEA